MRTFQYETWSPPDPQQNQPGRWNQQTSAPTEAIRAPCFFFDVLTLRCLSCAVRYFHIEFAPPQMPMMQPQMMQMPMMQPPMVQQPMAMSSQQPQMNPTYGQPVMMAQQPVGVPVIDPNAMGALMAAQLVCASPVFARLACAYRTLLLITRTLLSRSAHFGHRARCFLTQSPLPVFARVQANANAMAAALGQPQHVVVTGPDGKPHVQVVAPGQAPGQQPQYYVAQPPQHPQ